MRDRATDHVLGSPATLVLILVLSLGSELWRFAVSSDALPQWDMAQNGVAGVRLADALRGFDPLGLLSEIHALSTWPPTWPAVEAVAFVAFEPNLAVVRGLVATTWMLTVLVAFWALRPLGDGVGLLAAAWVAQAPLVQALATVNLLEVPGSFLLMLCLGCALRATGDAPLSRYRSRGRWWRATWAASLLLFFLKYNYGLLWLLPLWMAEERRRAGSWSRLGRAVVLRLSALWLRALRWRRPWTLFVVVYLSLLIVLLLAIRLSGGFDTEIFGLRLSVTSIGNPAHALFFLWCLRRLLGGPRSWRRLRRSGRRLDAHRHGMATWLLAPIALWMLPPPHMKEFFGFVENRSSGLGLTESLSLYPRVVVEHFSRLPWLAALVMTLAVVALGWLGSADGRRRLLVVVTLTGWLALLAHPYKLPRFASQAALLTGLLAAAWLLATLDRLGLRRQLGTLAAVVCVVCVASAGVDRQTVEVQHRLRTVPSGSEAVARAAARVAMGGGVVLGTWNELSPSLVEWQARTADPAGSRLGAAWRPVTTLDLDRRRDAGAVIRALSEGPCRTVAWIRSDRPGWRQETSWLAPVEAYLYSAGSGWLGAEGPDGPPNRLRVFRCVEPKKS